MTEHIRLEFNVEGGNFTRAGYVSSEIKKLLKRLNIDGAIILVSGNKPAEDTAGQSNEEAIPVLGTNLSCFDIAGKLYQLLKNDA